MLAGGITSIVWQAVLKEPAGVPAILLGLVASVIGYVIGHVMGTNESTPYSQEELK